MTSDSEHSASSASDGSGDEQGHPIDQVLSRRAASSGPVPQVPAQQVQHPASGPSSGVQPSRKRQLERASPPAASKQPRTLGAGGASPQGGRASSAGGGGSGGGAGSKEGSPESGEVVDEGEEPYSLDDAIEAVMATGSSEEEEEEDSGSGSESGYSSGSGTDSDGDDDDMTDAKQQQRHAAVPSLAAPTGVIVLGEGEEREHNAEVRRLLRMPRYFDPDYKEAGRRCFKCGGLGHMARDCTNEAKERPCFLCAQMGHDSRDCPSSLCFRCNRPGHMARDCPYGYKANAWDEAGQPVCLRCGREDCPCAGQRDYVRAEGGCRGEYSRSDLQHVRCADCLRRGHLSCKPAPTQPAKLSCHNCGEGGHTADECWKETPQAVSRERAGGRPAYPVQQRGGQPSSSGYAGGYSSGYAGGYDSYGGGSRYGGQQQSGYSRGQGGYGGAPKFANYTYAGEIDTRYQQHGGGGGGGQRRGQQQEERYVQQQRGYSTHIYGSYAGGGRR